MKKDNCYICGIAKANDEVSLCDNHQTRINNIDDCEITCVDQLGSSELGIIRNNRTFGTEIECVAPSERNAYVARYLAPQEFGWNSDESINTHDYGDKEGVEFKTCPLFGKFGEDTLTEFMNRLIDLKFEVNNSCGTHIHIGVPEFNLDTRAAHQKMKNLAVFYTIFDPLIRCLLPSMRRNNKYCLPIRNNYLAIDTVQHKLVEKHKKFKSLDEVFYRTDNKNNIKLYKDRKSCNGNTRYYGINFNSLYQRGTLEIRYHEGTLDPARLIHWIALHTAIVDHILSGKISESKIMEYAKIRTEKELLDSLVKMLGSNIDPSTAKYTIERFEQYKSETPSNGYIPEYRVEPKTLVLPIDIKRKVENEIIFEDEEEDCWCDDEEESYY